MVEKIRKIKKTRLSKGQRKHVRRLKQAERSETNFVNSTK